jgi:epoxyqueuosine reductase
MDTLTQKIVDAFLEWGADLVGVAPVERFAGAPEGHRPTDFMPECRSVISIALHLFQGMADVWGDYDQIDRTNTPYLFYGYGLTNLESSRMVNRMAKQLEYAGHKSLAFLPTWITSEAKYFDETLQNNEFAAEFSHRHAAVAAGIADFGLNGLALTPEFGSMQRFNSLLTSAELEPTSMWEGPGLCDGERCGTKCVRVCPAGAFDESVSQTCTIGGMEKTYAGHDDMRCTYGVCGMIKGAGARSEIEIPDGPGQFLGFYADYTSDKLHLYDRAMLDNCFGLICGDFCGKCLHMCPSKTITAASMKDYDLSDRFSSPNRARLL